MKLSTKGRYGIKALFELALNEGAGPVSLKAIADKQGLSEHYLEQLASPLRKAGLITSVRGAQGGYVLARPSNQITVGDILRVLEGPIGFTDPEEAAAAAFDPVAAVMNSLWEKVTQQVLSVVDDITLFDLVEQLKTEQAKDTLMFQI